MQLLYRFDTIDRYIGSIYTVDISTATFCVTAAPLFMIELAILGSLTEQELHGYELKKRLAELLGPWSAVSFGSLYPALARLERDGYLKAVDAETIETSPATGSLSGDLAAFRTLRTTRPTTGRRAKKVYGITNKGRARLIEMISDAHSDDRAFSLQVAFVGHLDSAARRSLFERRKAHLNAEVARRAGNPATTRSVSETPDRYGRAFREHHTRALRRELEWLDELLVEETNDKTPSAPGGSET